MIGGVSGGGGRKAIWGEPGLAEVLLCSNEHVTVDFLPVIRLCLSQITTDRCGVTGDNAPGAEALTYNFWCDCALPESLAIVTSSSGSTGFSALVDTLSVLCVGGRHGRLIASTELPLHSLYVAILFKSPIELALLLKSGAIKLLLNPHELLLKFHSASFTVASGDSEVLAFVMSRTIFGVCALDCLLACALAPPPPLVPRKDELLPK